MITKRIHPNFYMAIQVDLEHYRRKKTLLMNCLSEEQYRLKTTQYASIEDRSYCFWI